MAHDLEAQMRRLYDEAMNRGQLDVIDEVLADDFVEHEELPGLSGTDRNAVKAFFGIMRTAFPDMRFDVDDMVAAGDVVVTRAHMRGTHQGTFMGITATGREVDVPMIDWVRFRDGLAVEHWGVMDSGAMMAQLGIAPPPGD